MDLRCFRSRSRLKIRRAPSCKISAASIPSSRSSSSLHGSGCSRQIVKKECCNDKVRRPFIYHTLDPEIIVTEPAEFMAVVQRLTGSAQTRSALRKMTRKAEDVRGSAEEGEGEELKQVGKQVVQERRGCKDPLKEGTTTILAPSRSKPNMARHLPKRERGELNRTRGGSSCPPGSPTWSSLTTSSEGGASLDDESADFFVFSGDSYYGNSDAMEPVISISRLDFSDDDDHCISMLPSESNSYLGFFKEEEEVLYS